MQTPAVWFFFVSRCWLQVTVFFFTCGANSRFDDNNRVCYRLCADLEQRGGCGGREAEQACTPPATPGPSGDCLFVIKKYYLVINKRKYLLW